MTWELGIGFRVEGEPIGRRPLTIDLRHAKGLVSDYIGGYVGLKALCRDCISIM